MLFCQFTFQAVTKQSNFQLKNMKGLDKVEQRWTGPWHNCLSNSPQMCPIWKSVCKKTTWTPFLPLLTNQSGRKRKTYKKCSLFRTKIIKRRFVCWKSQHCPDQTTSAGKQGGGSVMLWECFSRDWSELMKRWMELNIKTLAVGRGLPSSRTATLKFQAERSGLDERFPSWSTRPAVPYAFRCFSTSNSNDFILREPSTATEPSKTTVSLSRLCCSSR